METKAALFSWLIWDLGICNVLFFHDSSQKLTNVVGSPCGFLFSRRSTPFAI